MPWSSPPTVHSRRWKPWPPSRVSPSSSSTGRRPKEAAAETVRQALSHRKAAGADRAALDIRAEIVDFAGKEKALQKAFAAGRVKGVVVLFGETNVKQPFFERTLAILEACLQERCLILLGGEIGAHRGLLMAELARNKSGLGADIAAGLKRDGLPAVASFGSAFELPDVVRLRSGLGCGTGGIGPARGLRVSRILPRLHVGCGSKPPEPRIHRPNR